MMFLVYLVFRPFYLICKMLIGLFGSSTNTKEN